MGSRPAELAMLVASIAHLGEGCGVGVECPGGGGGGGGGGIARHNKFCMAG